MLVSDLVLVHSRVRLEDSFYFSYLPLAEINTGLAADDVSEAATNTLDSGQGVCNLLSTVNVCVKHTVHVLEVVLVDDKVSLRWGGVEVRHACGEIIVCCIIQEYNGGVTRATRCSTGMASRVKARFRLCKFVHFMQ